MTTKLVVSPLKKSLEAEMDEAGDLIDLLVNTFGSDDHRVVSAIQTYRSIIGGEETADAEYAVGTAYLRWVKDNPDRTSDRHRKSCRCTAKFIAEDDGWSPCDVCLPNSWNDWDERTGGAMGRGDFDD